jgi:hypothetical protein
MATPTTAAMALWPPCRIARARRSNFKNEVSAAAVEYDVRVHRFAQLLDHAVVWEVAGNAWNVCCDAENGVRAS